MFNDDLPVVLKVQSSDLRLLLVSDIHLAFDNLQLLLNWHFENGTKKFDYILALGDFTDISYNEKEHG